VSSGVTDRYGNHLASAVNNDFQVINAVAWTNLSGGDWADPRNWSTGLLPKSNDTVLISTPLPKPITHLKGDDSIAELICDNPFYLKGGSLTVTGTVQIAQSFKISGLATLAPAHVVSGSASNGVLIIAGGVLQDLTLVSDAIVTNALGIVEGNLTVNGILTLGSDSNYGQLVFGDFHPTPQTLGGTGQIVFRGESESLLDFRAPMTLQPGLTIHGGRGVLQIGLRSTHQSRHDPGGCATEAHHGQRRAVH
jgi:hypothetical protein